jgi:hypothetical protein
MSVTITRDVHVRFLVVRTSPPTLCEHCLIPSTLYYDRDEKTLQNALPMGTDFSNVERIIQDNGKARNRSVSRTQRKEKKKEPLKYKRKRLKIFLTST